MCRPQWAHSFGHLRPACFKGVCPSHPRAKCISTSRTALSSQQHARIRLKWLLFYMTPHCVLFQGQMSHLRMHVPPQPDPSSSKIRLQRRSNRSFAVGVVRGSRGGMQLPRVEARLLKWARTHATSLLTFRVPCYG